MTVGKYEYSEEPHIITRTEIGDVEFNNTVLKIASQAARKGEYINIKLKTRKDAPSVFSSVLIKRVGKDYLEVKFDAESSPYKWSVSKIEEIESASFIKHSPLQNEPKLTIKTLPVIPKGFDPDIINQEEFDNYLSIHTPGYILIRYKSRRKSSANHWREVYVSSYDDKYLYSRIRLVDNKETPICYDRTKVVDYQGRKKNLFE